MNLDKFFKRIGIASEYAFLGLAYGCIYALCCGAWWQVFWLAFSVILWVMQHRENYGEFHRTWSEWLLEFLLVIRVKHKKHRLIIWSPTSYVIVLLLYVIAGVYDGICYGINDIREVFANRRAARREKRNERQIQAWEKYWGGEKSTDFTVNTENINN